MKPLAHRFYEFGSFRLDAANTCLQREQEIIRLTPKVFDLLLVLVQSKGRLIEREELIDALWSDAAVEEANLTQSMSKLRGALGCGQNGQRYIETLPKRGYRFVAPVREFDYEEELIIQQNFRGQLVIEQEEVNQTTATTVATSSKPLFIALLLSWMATNKVKAIGGAIIILIAPLIVWWLIHTLRPPGTIDWRSSLKLVQLANFKSERDSSIDRAKFSPDGSMIAFSLPGEKGGNDIWVMHIKGGRKIQVTSGAANDFSPLWSPDNKETIAFISSLGKQTSICTVPYLGGSQTEVTTLSNKNTTLIKWSKDDSIYFEADGNLFALNTNSKEITQITNLERPRISPRYFALSPNNEWIVYTDQQDNQPDLWLLPRTGGLATRLTNDLAMERNTIWDTVGKRVIYASDLAGSIRLGITHIDTLQSESITFAQDDGYVSDISSNGAELLYCSKRDFGDLWQTNVDTSEEKQITSDIGMEFWPNISPDGEKVIFQAIRGERVVWYPKRGSLLSLSLQPDASSTLISEDGFEAQWSPNNHQLAFFRFTTGDGLNNLWSVSATGGNEKQLTTEGAIYGGQTPGLPYNVYQTKDFCWSPDGSKIAFCAKRNGISNVWLTFVDGSGEINASNNTDTSLKFYCPIWSSDGRRIAYTSKNSDQNQVEDCAVWVVNESLSMGESKGKNIYKTSSILRLIGWNSSADSVLIGTAGREEGATPTEVQLFQLPILGQEVKPLGILQSTYISNIHLSYDKKTLAFVAVHEDKDNLWVMPSTGGLPRKVTNNADPKIYLSSIAWSPDGKSIYYGKQERWDLITRIENFK